MEGLPIDTEWLEELPEELAKEAHELLSQFTTAALWMKTAMERKDSDLHEQGHMAWGLASSLLHGSYLIAQIESARGGEIGINHDVLEGVQRSMFSGLIVACVRYGQSHPNTFLEFNHEEIAEMLRGLEHPGEGGGAGTEPTNDQQ